MSFYCTYMLVTMLMGQPGGAKSPGSAAGMTALGEPYIDGSEEFSIRPPMDWQLNRQRIPDTSGVTLLRMLGPPMGGRERQITLRRTVTPKRMTPDETLKQMVDTLGLGVNIEKVETQQVEQIAGKSGAFVSAIHVRESQHWQRMQAMVEVSPRSYLALIYDGPAEATTQNEAMFQMVTASLKLLQRRLNEDELKEAIDAGVAWRDSLTPTMLKAALIPSQYFRVELEGGEGFLVIEQGEYSLELPRTLPDEKHPVPVVIPGIRIAERGWRFGREGRAESFENMMFMGLDQLDEKWITKTATYVPAAAGKSAFLEGTEESGLRAKDVLLSGQTYALRVPKTENPALKLPKSYISRALLRMLPALVKNGDQARRMAFTTFDHLRGDLVVRLIEFKGAATPPDIAVRGKSFLIDDYEGLASEPTHWYVGEDGKILFAKHGRMTMKPVDAKELEKAMQTRVNEADRKISEMEKAYREDEQRFQRGK